MASSSQAALSLFLLLVAASSSSSPAAVLAAGDDDADAGNNQHGLLTHIHLYVHEKFAGPNATAAVGMVASPLGPNATFGSMGVVDDELRDGPDRVSSGLMGRFQGFIVGVDLHPGSGYITSVTLVFAAGEYAGSTVSIQGPLLSFTAPIERAVVGGTGKFRLAQGYSVTRSLGNPTPETVVYEVDLFVLMMHRGQY
ncbi:hypothetical protein PR202_gb21635 [Eleusine coracana subsp. coracana]|uniref:Dirigent protein n=1 Tax=Eleusine coracana subsp. coracana TaxID=191504 RepID=A0AAV5FBM7_ELECO|nr:hypothetical protein QOZ80_7BG0608440 [Eleusine coracana subsp. coracana]GJN33073.1 hypothetical protein PR202_gb21635 [Eleusine coracana subsp. coracana]